MVPFKMAHAVISTNFDLESVLEQYAQTYPDGDLYNYQVVYKTTGEHHADSRSYIIVFEYRSGRKHPGFGEFLKSYCTLNRLVAVGHPMNHVFPDISGKVGQGHVFGKYLKG